MKRSGILLLVLALTMFLSTGVFAEETCRIIPKTDSSYDASKVLMGLSDLTNAHGELKEQTNYAYVIQCNFAASTQCTANNKVIGLSAPTNAHAEIPDGTSYLENDVCYGDDLFCTSSTDECGTGSVALSPFGMLSLSGDGTNAHIGPANSSGYGVKICCSSPSMTYTYWSKNGQSAASVTDVAPGETKIKMVLKNSVADTLLNFEILEKDPSDDDLIITKSGTTNVNGGLVLEWTITIDDLDKGSPLLESESYEEMEFYFNVKNGEELLATSGNLQIGTVKEEGFCDSITICSDYLETDCIEDVCTVAGDSVGNATCNPLAGENCYCKWDVNSCKGVSEILTLNEQGEQQSTSCVRSPGERIGDCSAGDSEVSYPWTGKWFVNGEEVTSCGSDDEACSSCREGGSITASCSSLVQLPFFNAYNFVIAGILVALIYVVFNVIEKNHKKKNRKRH